MPTARPFTPVFAQDLKQFIATALQTVGIPSISAIQVAQLMADADLQGSDGHGVIRLPQYVKRIKAGGINTKPVMKTMSERAAMAVIDGDNGMGHLVVSHAVEIAIEKARTCGVGWVNTRNSNHAGPASLYTAMAVKHEMIGLYFAVGNANHLPPWGGTEMLLSTNPIAVGIPTEVDPAIMLDMATTVTAYGKVKAKAKRGELMPEGWMIDRQGKPLLDPTRADEGFLLPIGGHKGYGLALIVGLLAGTLGGGAMGKDVIDFNKDHKSITNTGQAILVIDPKAFGDLFTFKAEVAKLVQDIHHSERLPGVERIWLPGEQSAERRKQNQAHGIPLALGLINELNELAHELNIKPLINSDADISTAASL
jgi:L-2-hydroxycarboxylate dehydrogenase (NAD+)